MPNELTQLKVTEVSLVDAPANSEYIDGEKVPRARVAIWKRDGTICERITDEDGDVMIIKRQLTKEETMSNFEQVLKSATTRQDIVKAVERETDRVVTHDGVSRTKAIAQLWTETGAYERYKSAPEAMQPPEPELMAITKAEIQLDRLARTRMQESGETYSVALRKTLEARPELYDQYRKELAAGETYVVPRPDGYFAKGLGTSDGGECPSCEADVEKSDRFCRGCGSDLKKQPI